MDVLFIVVILIIGLLTWRGARRGIRGLFFGIIAWIFTLGFVSWITPNVEVYLNMSSFRPWVYSHVEEHIREKADAQTKEQDTSLQDLIDGMKLPVLTKWAEEAEEHAHTQVEEVKETIIQSITEELTARIIAAVAMMISIVIALIICLVISMMLRVIHDMPIVGGISRLIGGTWGFCEGVLVVWVMFILITSTAMSELGQKLMISIMNNRFLCFLYQNNLILSAITQIRNAIGG